MPFYLYHRCSDTNTIADADGYSYVHSDGDRYVYSNCDRYIYSNRDRDIHSDRNSDTDSNPNTNNNAKPGLWRCRFSLSSERQYPLRGCYRSTQQRSGDLFLRRADQLWPDPARVNRVRCLFHSE